MDSMRRPTSASWRTITISILVTVFVAENARAQVSLQTPGSGTTGQTSPSAPAAGTQSQQSQVVEPGDVYPASSRVYGFVGKTGFGHEHGVVGMLRTGHLQLDATQNPGQFEFDLKSFAVDADVARQYVGLSGTEGVANQQEMTRTMLGPEILASDQFPTAVFTVRTVTKLPQLSARKLPQYQLDGDFTLHGVTQKIQVVADVEEQNGWSHLRGGFVLQQTLFGIRPYTKALGAVGVADSLKVYGDLWLAKDRQVISPTDGQWRAPSH